MAALPNSEPPAIAPRPLSRRALLRMALLAGAGLVLSACSVWKSFTSSRAREKAQLVYQDWSTDWFPSMAQEMLAQFQAQQPNIRVFYTPDPPNLAEQMLTDMRAGTAADVFQGCCSHFPLWAQKGYCLDLRHYVAADLDSATIADWDPAQYRSFFARDGRQYGLPKYHGALALYYNKELFGAARVDYPDSSWTYDDYAQAMMRLTHNPNGKPDIWGSMIDVTWDRIQVHVNAWGGHLADPADPNHCLMDEPAAMQALAWIQERVWKDRTMTTPVAMQNVGTSETFASGKLAMVEDGSWALKYILSEAAFPVGVTVMPAGPARRATLATTDGFGIFNGTKYPDAAWELIKFLIGADYGRAMARAHLLQPARASLVDEWVGFIRAEYPQQATGMDLNAFADGQVNGYSVTAEVFSNMDEATRIANVAWDRILSLGNASVEEIRTACEQINKAQQGNQ